MSPRSPGGICDCEHCRRMFREYCAMDLPRALNQHDPARRKKIVWRDQWFFELWRLWDGEIRKIKPAARYIADPGGATSVVVHWSGPGAGERGKEIAKGYCGSM